MNLNKVILTMVVTVSVSQSTFAAPFHHTPEYLSLNQRSYQLERSDYRTDPAFDAYCEKYARVAYKQSQRRLNRCRNDIPLYNAKIRARWSNNYRGHRNWCNNVSSKVSGIENRIRESQLRHCIVNLPSTILTRQQCVQNNKFHKAAAKADINFVRRCLDLGVNINQRETANNWTALHSAARNGRLNIVRLLVQRGAYINARDIYNRTPLDQARITHNHPVINYLISHGAVSRNNG